jgi:RNA polymerase sigma factor (TIGR02999 family)
MPSSPKEEDSPDLTTLLHAWREGSGTAFGSVIDQMYVELRRIAAFRLSQNGGAETLTPTDLLHEAILGVMPKTMDFKNRAHFIATMSLAIRSILVDHARARAALKRGGDQVRVTLTGIEPGEESQAINLLSIEQALTELEAHDPRCGQIMHLTYFAGLEQDDIAMLLNTSVSTVTRDLKFARGWLARALRDEA